jgi:hypothetical protein
MIETVIVGVSISLLLILSLYLAVTNIKLRRNWKVISGELMQSLLDQTLIERELKDALVEIEQREIENTDGFVKFLSESRESAFKYIEETQQKLVDFQKAVEPMFDWSRSYGLVLGENSHTKTVEDIYQEYLKLKTIIPDEQGETNERNN